MQAQGGLLSEGGTSSRCRRDQQRASMFRRNVAASRQQQLLSSCVKLKDLCKNGKLQLTPHIDIMKQLQYRADKFRKQGRLQDEELEDIINKIKEGDDIMKTNNGRSGTAATEEHKRVMEAVTEGLLQIHKMAPNTKHDGIFRIMGKNCNKLNNRIGGNEKIGKLLDMKEDLDIDCLMICKHHLNYKHKDNKNDLKQMFQREISCTASSAHNVHEAKYAGRAQEGGTGTICFGESTGYITKIGQDEEGLGRWSWIRLSRTNGRATRIVTTYNPCKNRNINSGTTYQQLRWHFIMKKKDLTCPIILFRTHLIKQLTQWRAGGERIVLFMDHNEHIIKGALGKALVDKDGLDMREAVVQHTGVHPGATFLRGSKPIDGFWVTNDLKVSNASVMPFGYSVGDHRAFIPNIPIKSLVGINPVKIVCPAGRRLNSRLPGCSKVYIDSFK